MEINEYLDSGILELYVFGNLSDAENQEVADMASKHPDIQSEILSIEKAIVSLSFSMAPYLSAANFDRIKSQLLEKHQEVVQLKPRTNISAYMGWAAAVLLLIGAGYFYNQNQTSQSEVAQIIKEKSTLNADIKNLKLKKQQTEAILAVVRDETNSIIQLAGQAIAPTAKAKIYWNKTSQIVFVDASGLPEPPEGTEYQIWSLKLSPTLVPTSLGTLSAFKANDSKIFAVASTTGAEGFGITLEPKGGSPTPTMEQLYTLGKV